MIAKLKQSTPGSEAAIVAGARTPQMKSGTDLRDTHVTELGKHVIQQTLYRANWPADRLDEVILGNVCMPADATNPARVAALWAGVPDHVPALTVQRNCASGMEAVAEAALRIQGGQGQAILAGGAESMSTIPLLFPMETLGVVGRLYKARNVIQKLAAISKIRPRHFKPVAGLELGLTDPTCGMIMGKTGEVLAHEFGISRREQDEYALLSHQKAAKAMNNGAFADEITPMFAGKKHKPVTEDNGPRANQSIEALGKLRPFFDRRDGSVTVGNACPITDGASAVLVMDSELARAEGFDVMGYVKAYTYVGLDPSRMGLGPVFAIERLLKQTGVALSDIGLIEINEAFAVQVLACTKAMNSVRFAREHLDRNDAIGEVDMNKLNVNGGAIALGHPVGATGARMVLTLLMEMERRDVELGIAALCVGGGQGAAILLERK